MSTIFQNTEIDEEGSAPEVTEPFNPKSISIDTKPMVVQSIVTRLQQATIRLAPSFQRKEIWGIDQKSKLIESILLNIPLPMFYVAADERGSLDVVDGMQRLSALRDFMFEGGDIRNKPNGNGFRLQNLEFIRELNGCTFSELDVYYQNRIIEATLSFTIINPGTPEDVKFTIFSRVNTGGMPLTEQEVRHALYNGKSTNLLAELAESEILKSVIGPIFGHERMEDREFILRMLAFLIRNPSLYPGKGSRMADYLSETMLIINAMPDFKLPRFKKLFKDGGDVASFSVKTTDALRVFFIKGMKRAHKLFGDHAFRRSLPGNHKRRLNKSLFETWGCLLAQISPENFKEILDKKDVFFSLYEKLLEKTKFRDSVSRHALFPEMVRYRFDKISELISFFNGETSDK